MGSKSVDHSQSPYLSAGGRFTFLPTSRLGAAFQPGSWRGEIRPPFASRNPIPDAEPLGDVPELGGQDLFHLEPDLGRDRTIEGLRDPARDAGERVAVAAERDGVPNGVLVGRR